MNLKPMTASLANIKEIPMSSYINIKSDIKTFLTGGQRFVTLYRRQGSRPSPWKRNAKKQNGCLGRPYK